MPDPNRYKDKDKFVSDCIKMNIEEGKPQDQAVAICLSMWGRKKKAFDFKDVDRASKSKKKTVFLGGACDDGNKWRKEVIEKFKDRYTFIDPYDKKWEAEKNIYPELAGMLQADYIIFYRPGDLSEREKKFLGSIDKKYRQFKDMGGLEKYLVSLSKRKKVSSYIMDIAYALREGECA